jgi:uncharacterized protein
MKAPRYIDTNAWWGPWLRGGVRDDRAPAELARWLVRHGVVEALVSPLAALFADDPMPANRALQAALGGVKRLRALPVLNPVLPGAAADLAELALWPGVVAVRWLPAYHGYRLNDRRCLALAEAIGAAGLRLVITARLIDERHEHPVIRVKPLPAKILARTLPALAAAGGSRGRPLVQGLTKADLEHLAAAGVEDFAADLSFFEWEDTLKVLARSLPLRRAMVGTLTPMHVTAAQLAKAASETVGPRLRTAVAETNARAFFQL